MSRSSASPAMSVCARVEVLEASPDRREPAADPACGGAVYAHIALRAPAAVEGRDHRGRVPSHRATSRSTRRGGAAFSRARVSGARAPACAPASRRVLSRRHAHALRCRSRRPAPAGVDRGDRRHARSPRRAACRLRGVRAVGEHHGDRPRDPRRAARRREARRSRRAHSAPRGRDRPDDRPPRPDRDARGRGDRSPIVPPTCSAATRRSIRQRPGKDSRSRSFRAIGFSSASWCGA